MRWRNTRPFLDWNVVTTTANDPRSRYDGLGPCADENESPKGLTFDASYTLSKHKSDAGGDGPDHLRLRERCDHCRLLSRRCRLRQRRPSLGVIASSARSSTSCRLAVGGATSSNIGHGLDALVGGWDVTGITLFQSGPFLTPFFSNADPSGTGTERARVHRDAAARSDR